MSEQSAEGTGQGEEKAAGVERGGMEEATGVPLTETEIETSKKPEDRDSNV
jgi:hypothetical protein